MAQVKTATAAVAKKTLQDKAAKMHAVYKEGVQEMTKIMNAARKEIEAKSQAETGKSAEKMLQDL